MKKYRLDQLLVQRTLIENLDQAYRVILAGMVSVNGQLADKPGHKLAFDVDIHVKERLKYVSRGGLKIEGAYKEFKFDLKGSICVDIGASTGGFTDFMLQQGASKVYAIDCGTNQLHYRLRQDSRVVVLENTNARYISEKDMQSNITSMCDPVESLFELTTHGDQYQLILLDVRIPKLSGDEIYSSLEHVNPDILNRILFVTGYPEDLFERFPDKQFNVLQKPFRYTTFSKQLDAVLAN